MNLSPSRREFSATALGLPAALGAVADGGDAVYSAGSPVGRLFQRCAVSETSHSAAQMATRTISQRSALASPAAKAAAAEGFACVDLHTAFNGPGHDRDIGDLIARVRARWRRVILLRATGVAAVAAETLEQAQDAVAAIELDIEELNRRAHTGAFDLTKLSVGAFAGVPVQPSAPRIAIVPAWIPPLKLP